MHFAVDAIGEHALGTQRSAMAAFTLGLLLAFIAVRVNVRLIRAGVSWWFKDIAPGGMHIHHVVFGVILMVVTGLTEIAMVPTGLWAQVAAFFFGVGVALTLDEFALILHLDDVYWSEEGRVSVDAVVIVVAAAALFVSGLQPFADVGSGETEQTSRSIIAAFVLFNMTMAVLCFLKGKLWTGVVGIFIPLLALIGAIRLARPGSPWARRYEKHPRKQARAQRRDMRSAARVRAWRDVFFDLIAGKPHLPSVGKGDEKV